jgi:hypothetical protein
MSLEIELSPGAALPRGAHAGEPPRDAALAFARFLGRVPTPPSGAELPRAAAAQPRAAATSARIVAMTAA